MSGYALVEEVKKRTGMTSDNQVAEAIGKHRTNVSAWKRHKSDPDAETVLKLCMLGNIEPKKALEIMQGGYARVSLMAVTGIAGAALPYCYQVLKDCILC